MAQSCVPLLSRPKKAMTGLKYPKDHMDPPENPFDKRTGENRAREKPSDKGTVAVTGISLTSAEDCLEVFLSKESEE
jgi:hypothetical protein